MHRFSMALMLGVLLTAGSPLFAEETQNPEALNQFRMDGIAYDSNDPASSIVMINAIALRPGDEYHGFKVEEIQKDRVILTDAETKQAYKLVPGDGKANVQKAENWDPLKKLSDLKIPDVLPNAAAPGRVPAPLKGASVRPVAPKTGTALTGTSGLEKMWNGTPYMKAYAETKEKIEKIKADRDIRDAEINKMFGNNPEDAAAPKLNNKIE